MYASGIVVFSADTTYFPPLADFARGAGLLVHEAMLPAGVDSLVARTGNGARLREHLFASHSTAEDAGRIAAAAGVERLVLNHLIPADDRLVLRGWAPPRLAVRLSRAAKIWMLLRYGLV